MTEPVQNSSAANEVLEFLNSIEGAGYGGMASFEIARQYVREMVVHGDAQPVAWRVKNDFGHWHVTQDKALADTYRDVEKKDVQPLYLGVQPPAAPVKTAPLRLCGYCETWNSRPCGEGCYWSPTDPTIEKVKADDPASLEADALRWRQLPSHIEEFQIDYVGLKRAIDATLAAQPLASPVETTCPGGIDPGFEDCNRTRRTV